MSHAALGVLALGTVASACDSAGSSLAPPESPPHSGQGGAGGSTNNEGTGMIITLPMAGRTCGNGVIEAGEECDDGNKAIHDGCSYECQLDPGAPCPASGPCSHGDGKLGWGEECDDGNVTSGDGCTANSELEDGWECPQPGSPCRVRCGDGKITPPETCDDGNSVNGDGCARNCKLDPVCGAAAKKSPQAAALDAMESAGAGGEAGEGGASGGSGESGGGGGDIGGAGASQGGALGQGGAAAAAGGAAAGGGGKSSTCPPAACGDSVVSGDEQCDDGLNSGRYGSCLPNCSYAPYCGDGVVDPGEACDDGRNITLYAASGCAPGCRLPRHCGDAVVDWDDGESCDYGPLDSGACRHCHAYAGP